MAHSTTPIGGAAAYEVVPVTAGTQTQIKLRSGTDPKFLVGFMNLSASNQTVGGILTDLAGNVGQLPQIGQLAATQVVQMAPPGMPLYNGLSVLLSGVPIAPGIAMLIR